jgi:hypothetical protein
MGPVVVKWKRKFVVGLYFVDADLREGGTGSV